MALIHVQRAPLFVYSRSCEKGEAMEAGRDTHLKMTEDDLRAARVLTLAVKFFGASRPVPTSTIAAELYPGLDYEAFRRQYRRDRELLSTFGLVIREAGQVDGELLWGVDEDASYVRGETIGADEARTLYVLCHDMAFDQAFAYRDELRMALAKISQMYRGTVFAHTDRESTAEHKLLSTLVQSMGAHHGVAVTYTDAQGTTSDRTLALLGSFGLRGRTYFVASRVKQNGTLVPDSVRTYRLDRFVRVRELNGVSYHVPADFSVSDYERLPFQMGDSEGEALIKVTGNEGRGVTRAMANHGKVVERAGRRCWEVPYSSLEGLAAWCIAAGTMPLSPAALVEAREAALQAAAQGEAADPDLAGHDGTVSRAARSRSGRTGSVTVARQLVALASSLTHEGEVITAHDIASTLGVTYEQARHLIALVSMGSGESVDYLPVILSDDDDEVALMEGAQLSVPRVRLTRSETIALSAALTELGVAPDDPLSQKLAATFGAPAFSATDVARSLETPTSTTDGATLRICSQAISAGKGLVFAYVPVSGGERATRTVVPRLVRRSDDSWYLDAFDVNRQADRVFRIDRMDEVNVVERMQELPPFPQKDAEQIVTVRFRDRRYLDLFHWEGLEVLDEQEEGVVARVPYYGGSWLVRHLAACAGTVQVSDVGLAAQVRAYAQSQL